MNETIKVKGKVKLEVYSKEGVLVKTTGWVKNLLTATGLAELAGLAGNTGSPTAFTYLAVGTGTTAAVIGDTTLEAEISDSGLSRAAATVSRVTTSQTNDTLQLSKSFSVTGSKAVTECGILNAASSGTLLNRSVFSTLNVVNGQTLVITYKVVFA